MIRWQELIETARLLANAPGPDTEPPQESLRRAVSTAYYAMFHALANSNADCLIGASHDALTEHAWNRIYRGLDHQAARRSLTQDQELFSSAIRYFGDIFSELQGARHVADYDQTQTFTLAETVSRIDRAEEAINGFLGVRIDERRAIAAQTLVRRRTN